ncbi:hypothetical protein [Paracidovorax konjaci]|uniref:hypothetical protein n=1 Tax=Paracidovorax konjaci TaxID=32040 RepID=UPI0011145333|nr:hypothetical protein [Paracidovorax konjaci]
MLWRGVENQRLNAVKATEGASVTTELLQLACIRAKVVASPNPHNAQLHSVELGVFLDLVRLTLRVHVPPHNRQAIRFNYATRNGGTGQRCGNLATKSGGTDSEIKDSACC